MCADHAVGAHQQFAFDFNPNQRKLSVFKLERRIAGAGKTEECICPMMDAKYRLRVNSIHHGRRLACKIDKLYHFTFARTTKRCLCAFCFYALALRLFFNEFSAFAQALTEQNQHIIRRAASCNESEARRINKSRLMISATVWLDGSALFATT